MKKLNHNDIEMVFKQGLKANINTTVTKARAWVGEPHYTTDTGQTYLHNGTENIPILSEPKEIETVTSNTTLDDIQINVIVDASAGAVTITLPDATTRQGKEYVIIGYDASNTITIDTTSSQDIRLSVSDVGNTSQSVTQGEVYKLISTGTYWQVI